MKKLFMSLIMALLLSAIGAQALGESERYLLETSGKGSGIGLSGGYTIVTPLPNGKNYISAICYLYNNTEQTVEIDTKTSGMLFGNKDMEFIDDAFLFVEDVSTETIAPGEYALLCCEGIATWDMDECKYAAFAVFANPKESAYSNQGMFTMTDAYAEGDNAVIVFDAEGLRNEHTYQVIMLAFDISTGMDFLWGEHITYKPEDGSIKAIIPQYQKELLFTDSKETRFIAVVYEKQAGF